MEGVELLKARPLQCFKRWGYGHTKNKCTAEIDRSGICYRCGRRAQRLDVHRKAVLRNLRRGRAERSTPHGISGLFHCEQEGQTNAPR